MIAGHRGRHPYKASESFNNTLRGELDRLKEALDEGFITNAEIPDEVLRISNEMQMSVARGDILLYNHDDFMILEDLVGSGLQH